MRNVSKEIIHTKEVNVTETIVQENISQILENKNAKIMQVTVESYNANNELILKKDYVVDNGNYDLLMSANPSFAPNKPENEYRESDLWYIIDLINN